MRDRIRDRVKAGDILEQIDAQALFDKAFVYRSCRRFQQELYDLGGTVALPLFQESKEHLFSLTLGSNDW